LSVKQWYSDVCSRPLELIIGLLVFATAAAGGAVESVASTSLGILLIISFVYVRSWPNLWRQLGSEERLVLWGFGLYFLSAVISYVNVSDDHEYIKHLGRYLRFFLIVPIYLLLSRSDLKLFKYLLAGAVVSGPLYLSIALVSIGERPNHPAAGGYHHITFGDLAMLGAMFMTTVLVMMKTSKAMKIILMISIVCLLYSSILSTARGAWLAIPFCLLLVLVAGVRHGKIKIRTMMFALLVLGVGVAVSPGSHIISSGVNEAADNLDTFQSGEKENTSVGVRLAMWRIAVDVWQEHPFIGTGPGDFDLEMEARNDRRPHEKLQVNSSAHNIYFQALATTGTIGFVMLGFALVVLPFWFFYRTYKEKMNVSAVSGMVVITAFAVFGLTESWMLRSPVIAVYVVYFVTLATSASKNEVGSGQFSVGSKN